MFLAWMAQLKSELGLHKQNPDLYNTSPMTGGDIGGEVERLSTQLTTSTSPRTHVFQTRKLCFGKEMIKIGHPHNYNPKQQNVHACKREAKKRQQHQTQTTTSSKTTHDDIENKLGGDLAVVAVERGKQKKRNPDFWRRSAGHRRGGGGGT